MAFLIEAERKSVLYSGDLRMHGRKPGMLKTLLTEVAPKQVNVLLMEGTHFGSTRDQGITEYELEDQIVEHVRSAPGIVLAAFSPVDLDRLVTYYRAAQRTGRMFVADAYTAFILHLTASEARVPRPTTEAGIRVYFNRAFERRSIENLSRLFEPDRIALADILAQPGQFLMVFRPSMTDLDFGGKLPDKSRVLFSYWAGYLTKPDWTQLRQQVTAVDGDFIPAHASGHIYVADIIEFVKAVNPKLLVPIHTFEPERFRDHFANTHLLVDGQPFDIP
jgi:ribonuclease J